LGKCVNFIYLLLIIYIVFNVFWGLNYNRLGISYQLQLQPASYSTAELNKLAQQLTDSVNVQRRLLDKDIFYTTSSKVMFAQARESYNAAEKKYNFFHYNIGSVKSSLYGRAGNYLGFLGYYNPFTGEAQVNTTIPRFFASLYHLP